MKVDGSEERAVGGVRRIWEFRKYLVIEPFVFFYVMASIFNAVAIQNFPLEKACRVNLGYDQLVCETILDKSVLGIECEGINFDETTSSARGIDSSNLTAGFNYTVCKAERETQKLAADVSGKRAPIAAIFPLIVILFAGGWSDRYNKRKPCMIVPLIGEGLSFACLLTSAIFFDELPMEFGAYLEAIVPAMFGGLTFCLMAIYSYLTISTPEQDRVFRFGIFAMFVNAIPFIGQPISGYLFLKLGYVLSFAMGVIFQVIAILYVVFFIEEVRPMPTSKEANGAPSPPPLPDSPPPSKLHEGKSNLAYDPIDPNELITNSSKAVKFELSQQSSAISGDRKKRCSLLREFFDPSLVVDCIKLPLAKRENYGQPLLVLLILAYFLTLGPVAGENDYWYRYTLIKLNWNGNDFSIYSTISSALALLGTFIGTAILSKIFKISDSLIGLMSAMCVVISRPIFTFARNTSTFYLAAIVEMFVSLRVIAIKTIGSSIVDGEELSKMFAIFGISEPIGQFIFPPMFSIIYQNTVDTFPGAIFLFSEIFYVPNVVVFILCYTLLRKTKKGEDTVKDSGSKENAEPEFEVTNL